MWKCTKFAVLLLAFSICASNVFATTIEVRLRIRNDKSDEKILNRANLIKIKQFILQQGQTQTYCNMYNNNPVYRTKSYHFYLNPDSGQQNINCDPDKSDFHHLTIHILALTGKKNQYRTVDFLDEHDTYITSTWPRDDLTVSKIRDAVVDAVKEILAEIEKGNGEEAGFRRRQVAAAGWH